MRAWLLRGDCGERLSELRNESANLIFTSPPYADQRKDWYEGVSPSVYIDWFLPKSKEFLRVLANDGSFVLNIRESTDKKGERQTYVLELILALRKQGWLWTDEYIWHKSNPYPGWWPTRFRNAWERLLHFTKGSEFKMNQDAVKVPAEESTIKRTKWWLRSGSKLKPRQARTAMGLAAWEHGKTTYPTNVLYGHAETSFRAHPAVFPYWLPEWFITLFTDKGDTVLDPFVGSGTTGLAAIDLERKIIGMEMSDEYYELCKSNWQRRLSGETTKSLYRDGRRENSIDVEIKKRIPSRSLFE